MILRTDHIYFNQRIKNNSHSPSPERTCEATIRNFRIVQDEDGREAQKMLFLLKQIEKPMIDE